MWTKQYKMKNFYWGLKPAPFLKKYIKLFKKGRALDIGCGEGRNSIFLASNGFQVDAIDKNIVGIEKLQSFIQKHQIDNIKSQVVDVRDFDFQQNLYDLILAFFVLDFHKKSEIIKIIEKMKRATKPGGHICVTFFSSEDSLCVKLKDSSRAREVDENVFHLLNFGCFRSFLTEDECRDFFNDWKVVHFSKQERVDEHGDSGKHTHDIIYFIGQKLIK